VVISIIGILSAVILAALSTSRTRSQNAAIQSEVLQLRNQIELSWNGSAYTGLFGTTGTTGLYAPVANAALFSPNINSIVVNLLAQNGLSTSSNYGGSISVPGACPLYYAEVSYYLTAYEQYANALTIFTDNICGYATKYAIYAGYGPGNFVAGVTGTGPTGYYCIDSSGKSISKTSGYIPTTPTPTCQ
jgi:hypothetical protein